MKHHFFLFDRKMSKSDRHSCMVRESCRRFMRCSLNKRSKLEHIEIAYLNCEKNSKVGCNIILCFVPFSHEKISNYTFRGAL